MSNGSLAIRRLIEYLDETRDAFGNDISDRTNVLDLAAHYPYSPERWRIRVDGSRVFPEYTSVSQYTHDTDRHLLQPAAGETVVFESAERPRYVVQYELAATFSFALSQSLASGDLLRIGLYDGSDGWYAEQNGTHADDEADFVLERAGSVIYREADQQLARALTNFSRLRLQSAWYDITRQEWTQSFPRVSQHSGESDRNIQENTLVATGSAPDQRGPQTGNLPVHFEIQASGSTTGLELEAGSAAQVNLGKTTPLKRTGQITETINLDATDTWVPLLAFREDPDRSVVNTQIVDLAINEFGGNGDVEVAVLAFDPSKVLDTNGDELVAGDFSTPEILLAENSVIETTEAVEQIPDESGNTGTSQTDPGGIQIQHDVLTTASGNATASNTGTAVVAKRPLYARDVGVVVANSEATGDVTFSIRFEEDW
jgi:hypothetical protein